jgi:hypothetical protein
MASSFSPLPDKEFKIGDITVREYKMLTEDKQPAMIKVCATCPAGRHLVGFLLKDGKVIQADATPDAQDSGLYEKIAKKYSIKPEDLVFTTPTMAAAQSVVNERDEGSNKLKKAVGIAPKRYKGNILTLVESIQKKKVSKKLHKGGKPDFTKQECQVNRKSPGELKETEGWIKNKNSEPKQPLEDKVRQRYGILKKKDLQTTYR